MPIKIASISFPKKQDDRRKTIALCFVFT